MLKHCKLSKILQPVLLTTRFWDSLCRRVNLVLQRKDLLQLCTERKLNIFWLDFKISSRGENLKVSNSEFGETYVLVLITEGFHYRPQTKFAKVMFLHLSVSHSVHRRGSTWAGTPWAGTPPPDRYTPWCRYTPWAGTAPGQVHPWADTPPWAGTPPGRYTPRQIPLTSACWDMVNKQAVHILLECILVAITLSQHGKHKMTCSNEAIMVPK